MKKMANFFSQNPLFEGITPADCGKLLECIAPVLKRYPKGAFILMEGDEPEFTGMVRSGSLHIVRDDFWGNRTIVSRIAPPSLFAEALSMGGIKASPVSVVAAEDSEIVQLNPLTITGVCPRACPFHNRLVRNMAGLLAKKNIILMNKIELLTLPNTRLKLMTYLSDIAKTEKNDTVIIPFDRQGLADYLSVERSAMSAELCRMRDEGLLEFRKNRFRILRSEIDRAGPPDSGVKKSLHGQVYDTSD